MARWWGVATSEVISIDSTSSDDDFEDEREAAQLTVAMAKEAKEEKEM